jgi:hypothetical protein
VSPTGVELPGLVLVQPPAGKSAPTNPAINATRQIEPDLRKNVPPTLIVILFSWLPG